MARLFLIAILACVCLSQCDASQEFKRKVIEGINKARVNNGLNALKTSAVLNAKCKSWAWHMVKNNVNYGYRDQMINGKWSWPVTAHGTSRTYMSAQALVNLWMGRSTRPFLMKSDVTTIGFDFAWSAPDANTQNRRYKYIVSTQ